MSARIGRTTWWRRRRTGLTQPPELFEHTGAGLKLVSLSFSNWDISRVNDPINGGEVLCLKLMDLENDSLAKIKRVTVSHARVNGLFYQFKGVRETLGSGRDWSCYIDMANDNEIVLAP